MEEIGRRLKAAREAKGLTLQDVEDEIHIRKKYLDALESNRPGDIPGEVYLKGYIRTYGNFLGLDGDALVAEYKARLAAAQAQAQAAEDGVAAAAADGVAEGQAGAQAAESRPAAPPTYVRTPVSSSRGMRVRGRRRTGSSPRFRTSRRTYFFRRLIVLLILLVPIALLAYWLWWREPADTIAPPPAAQQEPSSQPAPNPQPQPEPQQEAQPAPQPEPPSRPLVTWGQPVGQHVAVTVTASPVVVEISGFRESYPWLEATVDGVLQFSGIMQGPMTFTGNVVELNIGRIKGMDFTINGRKFVEPLPDRAYVITITGQPQGQQSQSQQPAQQAQQSPQQPIQQSQQGQQQSLQGQPAQQGR